MTASVDIEARGNKAPAAAPCSDKQLASRPRSDAGASASSMVPQHTSRLRSSAEENREKMPAATFSWTMLRRLAHRLWLRTPLGRNSGRAPACAGSIEVPLQPRRQAAATMHATVNLDRRQRYRFTDIRDAERLEKR